MATKSIVKIETLEEENMNTVTTDYMTQLPPEIQAKMPGGKKCYSCCVRKRHKGFTVYLLEADLWERFREVGTEMIITKKGRRVFPIPLLIICDLDPGKLYNVTLEIKSVDNAVYKFMNGEWIASKEGSLLYPTPVPGREAYLHPFSPNTGQHWMREPISFSGLKISNNMDALGTIVLQSMRKYEMSLIISELGGPTCVQINLPETQFVAVTQYQNDKVTQMKIDNNPFANGFRFSSSKSKEKSKWRNCQETDTEAEIHPDGSSSCELSPRESPQDQGLPPGNRVENPPSVTQKVNEYLQEKRETLKKLLPQYLQQLKTVEWRDWHLQEHTEAYPYDFVEWSSIYVPHTTTRNLPRPFPIQNYMCAPGSGNPLVQVRQLGEMNRNFDGTVPLSLVTKKRSNISPPSSSDVINSKSPKVDLQRNPQSKHSSDDKVHLLMGSPESKLPPPQLTSTEFTHRPEFDLSVIKHNRRDQLIEKDKSVVSNTGSTNSYFSNWLAEVTKRGDNSPTDLTRMTNYNSTLAESSMSHFDSSLPEVAKPEVTLKNRALWDTIYEVVVSSEGRPMFPTISLSVTNLDPRLPYYIKLELMPDSCCFYDYRDHVWRPCLESTENYRPIVYDHPDSPRLGHEWGTTVLFDRLWLSTVRQGKNMVKIQLRTLYYPVLTIRTFVYSWTYPLKDARFITVSIDRSPYFQPRVNELCGRPSSQADRGFNENVQTPFQKESKSLKRVNSSSGHDEDTVKLTSECSSEPINLIKTHNVTRKLSSSHQQSFLFSRPELPSSSTQESSVKIVSVNNGDESLKNDTKISDEIKECRNTFGEGCSRWFSSDQCRKDSTASQSTPDCTLLEDSSLVSSISTLISKQHESELSQGSDTERLPMKSFLSQWKDDAVSTGTTVTASVIVIPAKR